MQPTIQRGIYLHYKQLRYEVLGCVQHSETLEPLVLYRALYGEGGLWVRPLAMFKEHVMVKGALVPRFQWLGPQPIDQPNLIPDIPKDQSKD